MNDVALAQILRQKNPWWQGERWRKTDVYLRALRDAPFIYAPAALADIKPPGLYVLTGPRRVGKSAEMRRTVAALIDSGVAPRSIIHCSCDGFSEQDLRRLFTVGRNVTRTEPGVRYWLIDEVTAVGDRWSAVVKDLRDEHPVSDDCVILTGSSSWGLREATKNLAGRRGPATDSFRLLLPMGFRDFCAATGLDDLPEHERVHPRDMRTERVKAVLDDLSYSVPELNAAWMDYLRVGGYPRAVTDLIRYGDVQQDFITDLWDVIRGEVINATATSDPEILALLNRLGVGLGSPVNLSTVARDIGFGSHNTVTARIDDLVHGYIAWRCLRAHGGVAQPTAQRKVYFTDPLTARIAQERGGGYVAPDETKVAEQQLGLALARAMERERPTSFTEAVGVFYERTKTDAEIDFVGPDIGLAYESKYGRRHWRQEARTVEANYPAAGIMATSDIYDTSHPAWAVPSSIVAWLLN